jgi:hypothetical protein
VGGWYGPRKGFRGRFANYVPPLMEYLGLAELEHNARNIRMRAFWAHPEPLAPVLGGAEGEVYGGRSPPLLETASA